MINSCFGANMCRRGSISPSGFIPILFAIVSLLTVKEARASIDPSDLPTLAEAISDTSLAVCGDYQNYGSSDSLEFKGAAKAEISRLLGLIAQGAVEGDGMARSEEYFGVLQKDLPAEHANVRKCRSKVFDTLMGLVDATQAASRHGAEVNMASKPKTARIGSMKFTLFGCAKDGGGSISCQMDMINSADKAVVYFNGRSNGSLYGNRGSVSAISYIEIGNYSADISSRKYIERNVARNVINPIEVVFSPLESDTTEIAELAMKFHKPNGMIRFYNIPLN